MKCHIKLPCNVIILPPIVLHPGECPWALLLLETYNAMKRESWQPQEATVVLWESFKITGR